MGKNRLCLDKFGRFGYKAKDTVIISVGNANKSISFLECAEKIRYIGDVHSNISMHMAKDIDFEGVLICAYTTRLNDRYSQGIANFSKNVKIKGNIASQCAVGYKSENLEIDVELLRFDEDTDENAYILCSSKNSLIQCNSLELNNALLFGGSTNCCIIAKANEQEPGIIVGKLEEKEKGLAINGGEISKSLNCYVLSDFLAVDNITQNFGGLITAQDLNAIKVDKLSTLIYVNTQADAIVENGIKYLGNWFTLKDYLSSEMLKKDRGDLSPLEILSIEKSKLADVAELKKELFNLLKLVKPIKEKFKQYTEVQAAARLDLIYEKTNKERIKYLKGLDLKLMDYLIKERELNVKNAEKLMKNKKFNMIINDFFIRPEIGMSANEFIETYTNVQKIREQSRVKGLTEEYTSFNGEYVIASKSIKLGEKDVDSKKIFLEGLDIIQKIRNGKVGINFHENESDKLKELISAKREISKKLHTGYKKSSQLRQRLTREKERVNEEIRKVKMQNVESVLKNFDINEDSVPNEISLQKCLDFIGENYINDKLKNHILYIANSLNIEKIGSNVLRIEVWDKTMDDIPTKDEYGCCALLGGEYSTIWGYMVNPAIQMLKVRVEDKKGIIITTAIKDKNEEKPVLLIDSAESITHLFARKDIVSTTIEGIKDYAKKAGFGKIIFSNRGQNTASHEFIDSAMEILNINSGMKPVIAKGELQNIYLDTDIKRIEAFSITL